MKKTIELLFILILLSNNLFGQNKFFIDLKAPQLEKVSINHEDIKINDLGSTCYNANEHYIKLNIYAKDISRFSVFVFTKDMDSIRIYSNKYSVDKIHKTGYEDVKIKLREGVNDINIYVRDEHSNENSYSFSVCYEEDLSPPIIPKFTSQVRGSTDLIVNKGEVIYFKGLVKDNVGVKKVRVLGKPAKLLSPYSKESIFDIRVELSENQEDVWVEAIDVNGNIGNYRFDIINRSTTEVTKVFTDKKALIIANSSYAPQGSYGGLGSQPKVDAQLISKSLEELGFEIEFYEDVTTKEKFETILKKYTKNLSSTTLNFFFYSGHGIETSKGDSYLIPVSLNSCHITDIEHKAFSLNWLLDVFGQTENEASVIVFDACRVRSCQKGNISGTSYNPTRNTNTDFVISYSTSHNSYAENSGVFAKSLAKNLKNKNLTVLQVFVEVAKEVKLLTDNSQSPWYTSNLSSFFKL